MKGRCQSDSGLFFNVHRIVRDAIESSRAASFLADNAELAPHKWRSGFRAKIGPAGREGLERWRQERSDGGCGRCICVPCRCHRGVGAGRAIGRGGDDAQAEYALGVCAAEGR